MTTRAKVSILVTLLCVAATFPTLPKVKKARKPVAAPTQGGAAMASKAALKSALIVVPPVRLLLSWPDVGATSYTVQAMTNSTWFMLTNTTGTNVTIIPPSPSKSFFRLMPQVTLLESDYSSEVTLFSPTNQTVTLAWDPSPNSSVAFYRLYQGRSPRAYTNSVAVTGSYSASLSVKAGTNTFSVTATGTGPLRLAIKRL